MASLQRGQPELLDYSRAFHWDEGVIMVAYGESDLGVEKKIHPKFLPEYMALLKTRSKKRLNYEQSRDFYRLAAMLANVAHNEEENEQKSTTLPEDMLTSSILEKSFQEKSAVFSATKTPHRTFAFEDELLPAVLTKLNRAMNFHDRWLHAKISDKYDIFGFLGAPERAVIRHGISFSPEEISMLLLAFEQHIKKALEKYETQITTTSALCALDFHLILNYFLEENSRQFLLFGSVLDQKTQVVVEQARIFWSHRMRLKSLQRKSGADPSTRYFHAAIRGEGGKKLDVVYWLALDDAQRLKNGGFIDHEGFIPEGLFCPWHVIETLARKMPYPFLVEEQDRAFLAVLQLYLDSLIS